MGLAVLAGLTVRGAEADVRHYVFDLDPDRIYDVIVDGHTVLDNVIPWRCGGISFLGAKSTPVAVEALDSAGIVDGGSAVEGDPAVRAILGPFPNPARGAARFILQAGCSVPASVDLLSLPSGTCVGRWTLSLSPGDNAIRVDLRSVTAASGLYVLQVRSGGAAYTVKFVYFE